MLGEVYITYLRALRDKLVIEVQEARSRCFNFGQNLLRLLHVLQERKTLKNVHYDSVAALLEKLCTYLSVILVQPFRLSSSMFLQFWEKVLQRKTEINT